MSESSEDEPLPKRKRGVVNENTYKRNTIRNARVKGQAVFLTLAGKYLRKPSPTFSLVSAMPNVI